MNCIDKGIESAKSMGITHFTNAIEIQGFVNRQWACAKSNIQDLHTGEPKEEEEVERVYTPSPTLEQVNEFIEEGGSVTVNIYYDPANIDAAYHIVEGEVQRYRANMLAMAAAYLETDFYPNKRVVTLDL